MRGFIAAFVVLLCAATCQAQTQSVGKLTKPSKEQQAQGIKDVKDAYENEYRDAKESSERKRALAETLLAAADQERNPGNRYALFVEAIRLLADAGDSTATFESIEQMGERFDVDQIVIKSFFLKKIADGAKGKSRNEQLADHFHDLISQAIAEDRFDKAVEITEKGVAYTKSSKQRKQARYFENKLAEIQKLQEQYRAVASALEILQDKPLDAAANQTVGEWQCLSKQNWATGISYLALGSHVPLKETAVLDLQGSTQPTDQANLGDRYWNLAEQMPSYTDALKRRAIFWYRISLPQLSGLSEKKIQKRLDEWEAAQEQLAQTETNQPSGKSDAPSNKTNKKQPKLAARPSLLTDLKALKPQAPIGPAGKPFWSLGGRVLIGNVPVQVGKATDIYLHPFPQPQVSSLTYNLKGRYKTLSGKVGIPNVRAWRHGPGAQTVFSVSLDGKRKIIHTTRRGRVGGKEPFTVDVTGVKKLSLETSCQGQRIDGCFAFWYSPQVSPQKLSAEDAENLDEDDRRRN